MINAIRLICFLLISIFSLGSYASDSPQEYVDGVNGPSVGASCYSNQYGHGKIVSRIPLFNVNPTLTLGVARRFCEGSDSSKHLGLIDAASVSSPYPTIAATYVLKGLNMAELEKVIGKSGYNPALLTCQVLNGVAIEGYGDSGFKDGNRTMKPTDNLSDMCYFADGSAISAFTLLYISTNPQYLGLREAIRSQPLLIPLPYINE